MNRLDVLIVEDDQAFARVLVNNLSERFNVKVANTGKEALSLIQEFKPDIIILDYMLPDTKGDALYTQLQYDVPSAEIVMLSANDSSKIVVDLVKLGVRNYVIKDDNVFKELDNLLKELKY